MSGLNISSSFTEPPRAIRTDRRHRGDHSTKCKNRNPVYEVPKTHTSRLGFIRDLVEKSQERDVTRSDVAMLARAQNRREKQFYPDAVKSLNALHAVLSEHVNVVTHQFEISYRNASDAAGLTTISDAEQAKADEDPHYTPKVCTARTSRRMKDMEEMGWIRAPKEWQVWDKEAGQWIDKYAEATPLFFMAAGITPERVEKQQQDRLTYIKDNHSKYGYTAEQAGRLTITQLRAERKLQWRKNAFERRGNEQARKKMQRELKEKTREEQRPIATKRVIAKLGDDIYSLGPDAHNIFKELVNKEMGTLRKFADVKPPPH